MKYKDTLEGDIAIFEIAGKVLNYEESFTLFHGQIHQYLNLNKKQVIVDLRKVELMGSVGLGMLISVLTTVQKGGGRLVLANITRIQNLIAMTRLNLIFDSYDSLEEAVASFENK
ncbi:MAG: STAS domain-containing protein [candidate division Zixibacteria bacterium]|nr:STAS domain-containing protein [candidate division Zixibacteria bacterium]